MSQRRSLSPLSVPPSPSPLFFWAIPLQQHLNHCESYPYSTVFPLHKKLVWSCCGWEMILSFYALVRHPVTAHLDVGFFFFGLFVSWLFEITWRTFWKINITERQRELSLVFSSFLMIHCEGIFCGINNFLKAFYRSVLYLTWSLVRNGQLSAVISFCAF